MKKRIYFFVSTGAGGAERVTVTIAKILDKDKYDVQIVVTGMADCEIARFIPRDMNVLFMNEEHLRLSFFNKVRNLISQDQPDFVFASLTFICIPLLIICKFWCRDVRVIVRGQINPRFWTKLSGKLKWKGCFVELANRVLYPLAYKVVAQTPTMRDGIIKFFGVKPEKCICLYNPIDKNTIDIKVTEASPFPDDKKIYKYVAVGRFQEQKGFDLLISAMKEVVRFNPNSHVYIVGPTGNSSEYLYLKKLREELEITENVHFEGFQDNPYKYMINADCFVLSSRYEGLPNVLIESVYLKKQAIAFSCVPIIEEIIQDGVNGLLVEPENVSKLSQAMIKIQGLDLNKSSRYHSSDNAAFNQLFS